MKPIQNDGYLKTVTLQMSAEEGPQKVKVDGKLADLITNKMAGQGDGRISEKDATEIAKAIQDGGRYANAEKTLTRALFRARDDRFEVQLNGQKIRLTDPAEKAFSHEMFSFWGQLGQKALQNTKDVEAPVNVQQAAQQFDASQKA